MPVRYHGNKDELLSWKIMKSKATFDNSNPNFQYRYSLMKLWNEALPKVTVIMLNPSIANELKNDPSVNRCLNYLIDNDYGSLEIVNLFAYVETDSKTLRASQEYIGPENNNYIREEIVNSTTVIVAWASDNDYRIRKREVLSLIGNRTIKYFEDFSGRNIPNHISRLKNGFELQDYKSTL